MIMENILDFAFNVVMSLFETVPVMHWDLPVGAIDSFLSVIDSVAWFFPMSTVSAIFAIIIAEEAVKIAIAFIRLIWKFIPIIGA